MPTCALPPTPQRSPSARRKAALRQTDDTAHAAAEALSLAREARAGAAARAENQDLRRIEMTRLSGERFACPPPLLGERIGFDVDKVGDPQDELVAPRQIAGRPRADRPGQSGRRDRAGRTRFGAARRGGGARRTGAGGQPVARVDRHAQPRRPPAAARRVRGGQRAFPAAVLDAVRRRRGAARTGRFGRSARGRAGDHGAAAGQEAAVADPACRAASRH